MGLFDDVVEGKIDHSEETSELFVESADEIFMEAYYPENIPYMKTMRKTIFLPKGKIKGRGNLCFLYADSSEDSINLIKDNVNFKDNNSYYFYFYNLFYKGKLYNKQFRRKNKDKRDLLYKRIKEETKLHPYMKLSIQPNENRNMYFDLSEYIDIFKSCCSNIQPTKKTKLYWNYMKSILFQDSMKAYERKFILIDMSKYTLDKKAKLSKKLDNPLYMIYYTMLRNSELLKEIDIDYYFYNNNYVLKINPSQTTNESFRILKVQMERLFSHVIKSDDIKNATDVREIISEEITDNVSVEINTSLNHSPSDEKILGAAKVAESDQISKKIDEKVKQARKSVENSEFIDTNNPKDVKDEIKKQTEELINEDQELLEEIYKKMMSEKKPQKSAASTARDEFLKKEQENLKLGEITVKELQKIQTSNIEVPVKDVSNKVNTINKDMRVMKFPNHDKTYEEKLMKKDIINSLLSFNNKSLPLFIRDIKVEDTSDELNYKDTYYIYFEDGNRQRHTVTIDMPKFIENRFLYIGGNRKVIKHQDLLLPVVKTGPDTVQITTNYNKMFIQRTNTKSLAGIERLKKIVKASDEIHSYCTFGSALSNNRSYVTSLEYDEISRFIISFKSPHGYFMFDQTVATEYAKTKKIDIPKNTMFIGVLRGRPIFIDYKTQKTIDNSNHIDENMTIIDTMMNSCNDEEKNQFLSTASPKKLMMAKVKVMEKFVFVGLLIGFWEGLSTILKKSKIKYRLENKKPKDMYSSESFIKFSNCYMIYEDTVLASLLLNAYKTIDTESHEIEEFDEKEVYMNYIVKVYGKTQIVNALLNVYEFMIDPITEEVLVDNSMPTDTVGVIIYAVNLLSDSQFVMEINKGLSRTRMGEIIPAIMYERLAKNYITYKNSNGRKKFTVPQNDVIKTLLKLPTVEDYSSLNPILELESFNGVSCKGFRGVNLDDAYTVPKRTYDPSMTGIIAPSSPPDAGVGVNKMLTMEPNIVSLRGYANLKDDKLNELNDVNLFSPSELSIPLAATTDDPTRLGLFHAWLSL